MKITLIMLSLTLLAACSQSDEMRTNNQSSKQKGTLGSAVDVTNIDNIAMDFKLMHKMTGESVPVNPEFAMLCRGLDKSEVEKLRETKGPHAYTYVDIYMNRLAANAFKNKQVPYPVGSIFVKDKSALGYWSNDPNDKMEDGVGGMLKREAGYDPGNGDWEYFYYTDPTKIERGKIKSCVECHAGAKATDHVFGGWADPKRLDLDIRAD